MKFRSSLLIGLLAMTPAAAFAEPVASGFWELQYEDGSPEGWFLVAEKNNVFYARLVKGFKKAGDTTPIKITCDACTGEKKGAHIMGLTLFWGFKRDGLSYTGGSVVDPRSGSVYHAKMTLSEDGKQLDVRGYLGIEMLGQTNTWHRLPDDAMKKEEIPKEILAGGPVGDAGEKPHVKKPKPAKTTEAAPAEPAPDASADPAAK